MDPAFCLCIWEEADNGSSVWVPTIPVWKPGWSSGFVTWVWPGPIQAVVATWWGNSRGPQWVEDCSLYFILYTLYSLYSLSVTLPLQNGA